MKPNEFDRELLVYVLLGVFIALGFAVRYL
jgi:hypothetical protein